jgi:DNA-directed RNA polymerase subunit H (RpoH/RPB5)
MLIPDSVIENIVTMFSNRFYKIDSLCEVTNGWVVDKDNSHSVYIYFCENEKLTLDNIREILSFLSSRSLFHSIVFYNQGYTPSVLKAFEHMDNKYDFELFAIHEFSYCLTSIPHYCPHSLLTKEESKQIKKIYGNHIPIITSKDMICRYFHFHKGDILRIHRKDGTLAYRIVR